jgi:hypothetical protein
MIAQFARIRLRFPYSPHTAANLRLKIAIFRKLRLFQHCQFLNIPVFFSKTSDFVVGRVLEFRLRLNIQRDIIYKKFLSLVEITNVILKNRQCWKRRNLRKIAIFHHKFNNEKVDLTRFFWYLKIGN